jgi:hypothetical protein
MMSGASTWTSWVRTLGESDSEELAGGRMAILTGIVATSHLIGNAGAFSAASNAEGPGIGDALSDLFGDDEDEAAPPAPAPRTISSPLTQPKPGSALPAPAPAPPALPAGPPVPVLP